MKKIALFIFTAALVAAAAVMYFCWDIPEEAIVYVNDVTLNKKMMSLIVGNTEMLTATVNPVGATAKSIIWSSSAQDVATVITTENDNHTLAIDIGQASGATGTSYSRVAAGGVESNVGSLVIIDH